MSAEDTRAALGWAGVDGWRGCTARSLVRCWQLGDGAQRFEIEQIRSGERMVVSSAAAAVA